MSYETIYQSTVDTALQHRLLAAIAKEAWAGTLGTTVAGVKVRLEGPNVLLPYIIWPACVDFEAAYAYALGNNPSPNPNPGSDPGVISEANIQSAVTAHWPSDQDLSYMTTSVRT